MLNIGIGGGTLPALEAGIGPVAARELYRRLIPTYALAVHGIDPEHFEGLAQRHLRAPGAKTDADALTGLIAAMLDLYADEAEAAFPQDPRDQLEGAARAMARAWNSASARILRQAKGAPLDAGLGLVAQDLALGIGPGISGAGHLQTVDSKTGAPACVGGFVCQGQQVVTRPGARRARKLTAAARVEARETEPSLEELAPAALACAEGAGRTRGDGAR